MNDEKRTFMRRRNYFIKKSFQTRFFTMFLLLLVAQAVLIGTLFMRIAGDTLTTGYCGPRFVVDKTSNFFLCNYIILSAVVGITVLIAGLLVFIFLSHRIAGPLYRFESALRGLQSGDLSSRVRLRKTDQLAELESAMNEAVDKLDGRLKELKADLEEADDSATKNNTAAAKEAIARARDKADFFKTS
ncbi:MAG: methyl-accepting chemotaxis protein [Candidatus Omnitrophica bacterium]|nr:methyl-accepting chemotaxis protein [Candidatus Omnitrophota bacterium]